MQSTLRDMNMYFPIKVDPYDTGHYIINPEVRKSFLAQKPKDNSWYAYGIRVYSKDHVDFIVYDIEDNAYGGIGKEIYSFTGSISQDEFETVCRNKARELAIQTEREEFEAKRKHRRDELYHLFVEQMLG